MKEAAATTGLSGRMVAHYRILEKLGEGGMGVVYRAQDTHLDRPVAIKVISAGAIDPERRRRFVQEAKAASALNHPNIVTIYDIDHADGLDFIAMEYVRGKTLHQLIGRKGLRPAEAVRHALQVADALAAAHAAGIVHRDIKPANVMVNEQGTVKLLDFGLAKLTELPDPGDETQTLALDESPRTAEGKIFGTAAYMSPEQAEGRRVDARSDIFSFGSVLYEMVTGARAFHGESKLSILAAVLNHEPKPVHEVGQGIPRELGRIISLCLRKDPGRRLQHMEDVRILLEQFREEGDSGAASQPPPARSRQAPVWISLALLLALIGVVAAWWITRRSTSKPQPVLSKLTWDSGLTQDPVLSPDGKFLAYASDRSGEGNLDIWVQQMAGGEPVRLTSNEADETSPSFSPDGARIAFHSDRAAGGLYVVPALGGQERLIARSGYNPQFSPDGAQVVYWVGEPANYAPSGKLYLIPSTGGTPVQLRPDFADARYPIWTPDGKHVLFQGVEHAAQQPDWYVTPLDSRPGVATGIFALLRSRGISVYMGPGGWRNDRIVFSGRAGAARSLYELRILPGTWRAAGAPERLTFGTGVDAEPFPGARGEIAFASLSFSNNLWSLPTTVGSGVASSLQRITQGTAYDIKPSVSADGDKIVFLSGRYGNQDVWIKDVKAGRESALTATPADEASPVISRDGSKVAYTMAGDPKQPIYVITAAVPPVSGVPESVCESCGEPVDWSPDGRSLLYLSGRPKTVGLLQLASGERNPLLQHSRYLLDQARFSPDGRWIAWTAYTEPNRARIYAAPVHGTRAIAEDQWIAVTDGQTWHDRPRWSPHGDAIYYYSKADGFGCIWKQPLEAATKRPAGSPVAVQHFHSSRLSMSHLSLQSLGLSVARDRLVFNLLELTGNIWVLQPDAAQ